MGFNGAAAAKIDYLMQRVEVLQWIAIVALLIALAAWIPWIFRSFPRKSAVKKKPLSQSGAPGHFNVSQKLSRAWINLRTHRTPVILSFLYIAVLITMLSSRIQIVPTVIFGFIAALSAVVLIFFSQKKIFSLGAFFCLAILLANLLSVSRIGDRTLWVAELLNLPAGVTATRYSGMNWNSNRSKRTVISEIDLNKSNSPLLHGDRFSILFKGYLYVPESGNYELSIASDDGSFLMMDGKTLISNPGYHALIDVSQSFFLTKGLHSFAVKYFNDTADAGIVLSWMPPNQSKQVIPGRYFFQQNVSESAFRTFDFIVTFLNSWLNILLIVAMTLCYAMDNRSFRRLFTREYLKNLWQKRRVVYQFTQKEFPSLLAGFLLGIAVFAVFWILYHGIGYAPCRHGLRAEMFKTEDFRESVQVFNGKQARFNSITSRIFHRNIFSVLFTGYFYADKPGRYQFGLQADNGARLFLDDLKLIDGWKANPRNRRKAGIHLTTGFHQVRIEMYNHYLPAFIDWSYAPPGSNRLRAVPLWNLYPTQPDPTLRSDDVRFHQLNFYGVLFLTGLILLLIVLSLRYSRIQSRFTLPLGVVLFLTLFLFHASRLDPDHRFGVNWFISLPASGKILVAIALLSLSIPGIRSMIRQVPGKIQASGWIPNVLFPASLISGIVGQIFFTGMNYPRPGMGALLFATAAFLVILNARMLQFPSETREEYPLEAVHILLFVLILCAAAFLRFYRLSEMPPGLWWDEAQTGIVSRDILNSHFPPIYDLRINAGSLASYMIALWFKIFGSSVWALRSYYATIGTITTGISYFFFRQYFHRWWSLFGMALIAVSRWLFSINRVAMATIDETILLSFLVFITYSKVLRTRKLRWYVITGILLGIGLYLHTGARVLPMIIGVDLLVRWFKEGKVFLRRQGIAALLMILIAWVVFAPMALHILHHPDDYFKRSKQTLLSTEYPGWYPVPPLLDNVVEYLKMYPWSGDWHPRHNWGRKPQLPPYVSVLALFGAAFFLARISSAFSRFYIMGFVLVSLQGILTVHNGTANLNRVAENIPIVHLMAVTGAVYIAIGFRRLFGRFGSRVMVPLLALCVIGFSTVRAYRIYFHDYLKSHDIIGAFGFQPELTEPAQYILNLLNENPSIQVWAENTRADSFRYILPGNSRLHDLSLHALPPRESRTDMAIVVLNQSHSLTGTIRKRFPGAEVKEIPYSLDKKFVLFRVFFVSSTRGDRADSQTDHFRRERVPDNHFSDSFR